MLKFLSAAVFVFALLTGVMAETGATATPDSTAAATPAANRKIIAYYFFFTPRCETCLNMEAYAKEAVEKYFPQELKQGRVEWHAFDTDQKEYEHFWTDFKLENKALVIVDERDGRIVRWKNCEQIWDLVNVKPTYMGYVRDEVRAYLND